MTRYTLTGSDLFVIMKTLHESMSVSGLFTTTREAREHVGCRIEQMLRGMTATVEVNNDEEDQ
jgi:hypothetical protein